MQTGRRSKRVARQVPLLSGYGTWPMRRTAGPTRLLCGDGIQWSLRLKKFLRERERIWL